MRLTSESLLGLKRHFIGALNMPSRIWLEPEPSPRVSLVSAQTLRTAPDHCLMDFGTVGSPGIETGVIRVANHGTQAIAATLAEVPAWVFVNWRNADGETIELPPDAVGEIELTIEHDVVRDTARFGVIVLHLADMAGRTSTESITVHIFAHPTQAIGEFTFENRHELSEFDFGLVDPCAPAPSGYRLSIRNVTSVPLTVSFSDLPAWLRFSVDGQERKGPLPGRFFERPAPIDALITPLADVEFLGHRTGAIRVHSNDARDAYRRFDLRFLARIEASAPLIRVAWSTDVQIVHRGKLQTEAMVENWGNVPARLSDAGRNVALSLAQPVEVAACRDGAPGVARLPIRVNASQLQPGFHELAFPLNVENGLPAVVVVPFRVNVAPAARRKGRRPRIETAIALIAALFVLVAWIAYLAQVHP